MRYMFQRVVHNDHQWTRPSAGRLRSKLDGGYLRDTGFGHEDWNLKKDKCSDGYVRGYTYYHPKNSDGLFNILFATYDKNEGWALAGYYERASFDIAPAQFRKTTLRHRADELKELDLADSLGEEYLGLSRGQMVKKLERDSSGYHWRVRPRNIHSIQAPLLLPHRLAGSFGKYFTTATEISKGRYDQILKFSHAYSDKVPKQDYPDGGDIEFPEGKKYQVLHFERERNYKLVREAKARFKRKYGKLYCEACEFDFKNKYGQAGVDFIEVHHLRPVSELKAGDRTKLSELALVCSNCHRMLHRQRPWPTIAALRNLIKANS